MEKKKTDWQTKAWIAGPIVGLACFMVFMTSLVLKTRGNVPELVQDNYYSEDLKSEEILSEFRNGHALKEQVKFEQSKRELKFVLPHKSIAGGEVYFYRASDSKLDKKIAIKLNDLGEMKFLNNDFAEGRWRIDLRWSKENKTYRFRKKFFIEK